VKPCQPSKAPLPDGMRVKAPTVNLTGKRFGRLVAVRVIGKHTNKSLLWECLCDCGTLINRSAAALRKTTGKPSCGCYLKEVSRERLANIVPWNRGTRYRNHKIYTVYKNKKAWATAVKLEKGDKCSVCGWDKASCDVHHVVSKSDGGCNTIDNGVVVCPNCHREMHKGSL
jgi:hypothetical protein